MHYQEGYYDIEHFTSLKIKSQNQSYSNQQLACSVRYQRVTYLSTTKSPNTTRLAVLDAIIHKQSSAKLT